MGTPNSLFILFHVANPDLVEEKLKAIAPWLSLKIDEASWAVIAPSGTTTKEVCDKVGVMTGASAGIVVRGDSYFGIAAPSIWEWLATKQGAVLGTPTPV